MDNKYSVYIKVFLGLIVVVALLGLYAVVNSPTQVGPQVPGSGNGSSGNNGTDPVPGASSSFDQQVKSFASAQEFQEYMTAGQELANLSGGLMMRSGLDMAMPLSAPAPDFGVGFEESARLSQNASGIGSGGGAERFSTTNVQVQGIDEPDIVKTDGEEIFFSSPVYFYGGFPEPRPLIEPGVMLDEPVGVSAPSRILPPQRQGGVKAVKAFPPADLEVDATIDGQGDLLLNDDVLMVFSGNLVSAYDVSDPQNPEETWDIEMKDNTWIADSRLANGKLYLVTRTWARSDLPCPIRPLAVNGSEIIIPCIDIYHPISPISVDSTYTAHVIDSKTGEIEDSASFVGSSGQSVVYMSPDALYITYNQPGDMLGIIAGFFSQNSDLFPSWLIDRLNNLSELDISQQAKMTELGVLMQQFQQTLDQDERLKLDNETQNRMADYIDKRGREIERTGIIKIGLDSMQVLASGSAPGVPLNQFALDEYQGHLRVATTISNRLGWFGLGSGGGESVSDVTILDGSLLTTGSVQNLGRDERIFAVRFIQDKGYVVTFRQIDPFFVLDLSDPASPQLKGELKIPGFSSYLHPISKDKIVGVGRDNNRVKISLFNVSDPTNPQEADNYQLNEYWSEIQNTHHAFLLDDKHEIFFLPANLGGYIFNYSGSQIALERAVSGIRARRAVFINDYLYIIGDDKIIVLNENDWTRVNELNWR